MGLFVMAIVLLIVFLSDWLAKNTFLKKLGAALLVILLGAIASNLGVIPTTSSEVNKVPFYNFAFEVLAPLSIFLFLLQVNLREVLKAGKVMIFLFLVGTFGTAIGAIIGIHLINGQELLGDIYAPIAGMFTGTYSGGGVNFNAIALHYNVMEKGIVFAACVAADNIITAIWMVVTLGAPKLLSGKGRYPSIPISDQVDLKESMDDPDEESINPGELGLVLGIGILIVWVSDQMSNWSAEHGFSVPSIILLSIVALILAQFQSINKWKGIKTMAMFSVYIFLTVIGAYCDFGALSDVGTTGVALLAFATLIILFHGIFLYGLGYFLKQDPILISVASQANIGGGTTALVVARSYGQNSLVLPAILIGTLGNALGTFVGFWVVSMV